MENSIEHTASDAHTIQVAKNACYDLLYNEVKNRIYFKIRGFWKNKESVPDFLVDWDKALTYVQPNFTVITDMSSMVTHPQELKGLHAEAQHKVRTAGVLQVANVMPDDKIARLQIAAIANTTHLVTRDFDSLQEAEQWLDGFVLPHN